MTIRNELAGAGQFYADRKVEALLLGEARRRVVTRMFGIPAEEQSLLVTMLLAGSVATVLGGLVARPVPHPSRGDAVIGGAVLNVSIGALAGVSARTAPLAGGLIAFAVVAHAIRPTMAASADRGRAFMHGLRVTYDNRYAT